MSTYKDVVQAAFPDKELCSRILTEAAHEPTRLPRVFEEISRYVLSLRGQTSDEIPNHAKKRKLEDVGSTQTNGAAIAGIANLVLSFECKDVSFQAPARKKLKLQLVGDAQDKRRKEIRLLAPASDKPEYALAGEHVDQAFCLPVPEKQARQMNIILFPKSGANFADGVPAEPILFTLNEIPPAGVAGADFGPVEDDTYVTVTKSALARFMSPYGNKVVMPSADEFASSIPQSHRKGEKAYHVNAHRGSKEGYLFFLENGIVFGFKKPLAFFPFSAIESISYTSVLHRTFNLVIGAMEGEPGRADGSVKEIEFSMLDQADFAGIDEYVKRHGLNDASMAAERRAKAYNVNKDKKGVETNGDMGSGAVGDGSELQKAEQELQDEEDDLEEDYVESEGEEDDSEEDEEGYEEEGYEEGEEEEEDEVEGEEDVGDD